MQIRATRLQDAHLGARSSRLVCFAQVLVRRPRSTSAGCESRLQVCDAQVWTHGVGVYVLIGRHTWAHASAIQPLSCRVTARRCLRGRRIMLVKTKVPSYPSALMRLANLPFAASQRPGRACLFGIHGPQLCPPLPRASMTPPLIVDSFLSAKAALSSHHMPCSAFLSWSM